MKDGAEGAQGNERTLRGGGVQSRGGKGGCGCRCVRRLDGGRSRAFLVEEFTSGG